MSDTMATQDQDKIAPISKVVGKKGEYLLSEGIFYGSHILWSGNIHI